MTNILQNIVYFLMFPCLIVRFVWGVFFDYSGEICLIKSSVVRFLFIQIIFEVKWNQSFIDEKNFASKFHSLKFCL